MLDVNRTVISQYANSPTLRALIDNLNEYLDPRANFEAFYNYVWNVDTAVGFGLDIWGKIVGVGRLIQLPNNPDTFGFHNASVPQDWRPFNQGTFNSGGNTTSAFLLPDDAYRTLILTKAFANIVATTTPALNALLRNLFPGRGRCYVLDNLNMTMSFVFEFALTSTEYAILQYSGVLPHPAGVGYNVVVLPSGRFAFNEYGPTAEPFNFGVFAN